MLNIIHIILKDAVTMISNLYKKAINAKCDVTEDLG